MLKMCNTVNNNTDSPPKQKLFEFSVTQGYRVVLTPERLRSADLHLWCMCAEADKV